MPDPHKAPIVDRMLRKQAEFVVLPDSAKLNEIYKLLTLLDLKVDALKISDAR